MTASSSKPNGRNTMLRRLGAGLLAVSFALAATPALADGKHKHWNGHDNGNHYGHYKKHPQVVRYYDDYDEPDVIYVERPVYVRERVYVEPRRVYVAPRPSINIVVPLFD
jgi:hypothetical protein